MDNLYNYAKNSIEPSETDIMASTSMKTPDPAMPAKPTDAKSSDDKIDDPRGTKRNAPDDDVDDDGEDAEHDGSEAADAAEDSKPLSKNQLRKQKRRKMYEEGKKEKRKQRKERRREQRNQQREENEAEKIAAAAEGREAVLIHDLAPKKTVVKNAQRVPVAVVVDCQFEKYMLEGELISLSNQVTRCYSDNRNAQFPVHLYISSFGGHLESRYQTVLKNQYKGWKNVHFTPQDFVDASHNAQELMKSEKGGKLNDVLNITHEGDSVSETATPTEELSSKKAKKQQHLQLAPEAADVDKSIVYLTADSPYTLSRLEPNTCYVVGGIIDKNREKGLCYKIARDRNVRTAKLPIGQFMAMQSRHILATNHVVQIMLKWLETGDWGEAFMQVIPTRKGGEAVEGC